MVMYIASIIVFIFAMKLEASTLEKLALLSFAGFILWLELYFSE